MSIWCLTIFVYTLIRHLSLLRHEQPCRLAPGFERKWQPPQSAVRLLTKQTSSLADTLSLESIQANMASLQAKAATLRMPQEFFDVRHFSKPADFSEIQQRVTYNIGYYQSNYVLIVLLLSLYALITNSLLMIVVGLVLGGLFVIRRLEGADLVTPFGVFTTSQLYTGLLVVAVPLGFLASPISTMMWLIGSSCACVFAHAALMEKPIETVFEETV